ncbi:MAG TPA: hypothetical protein VGD78_06940 [Chthoniobacterales bacterium]
MHLPQNWLLATALVLGLAGLEVAAQGQGTPPRVVGKLVLPAGLSALAGSYVILPEASDSAIPPIHAAARSFNVFQRGLAINRLNLVNPPLTSVIIQVPNAHTAVLLTDGWPAFTHRLDGTATRWQRNAAEWYDVSARYAAGGLEQRFSGAHGQRINRYTVSRDHRFLWMEVLVVSPELALPVRYTLTFARL